MVRQGAEAIVNLGSVVPGRRGINSTVDHTATKAGVPGWTRTLARQYGSQGVRVILA
jgi:NAD(P)-dependent dehydrogenase (short-subunit alcohol dehydrogenase family)